MKHLKEFVFSMIVLLMLACNVFAQSQAQEDARAAVIALEEVCIGKKAMAWDLDDIAFWAMLTADQARVDAVMVVGENSCILSVDAGDYASGVTLYSDGHSGPLVGSVEKGRGDGDLMAGEMAWMEGEYATALDDYANATTHFNTANGDFDFGIAKLPLAEAKFESATNDYLQCAGL